MIVYTQGSFDMPHEGHMRLLERCAMIGEVYVSILSDESYESYRGYPPVYPFEQRKAVIASNKHVTLCFKGDNKRTEEELLEVFPDFVVVGSDWAKKDIYKQYGLSPEWFENHEIEILFFPYTETISSTQLRERCRNSQ